MAGGAPTSPKTMNVSQLHDVMTIMHQQMLSNKNKSKEFAKTILQIQTASKKLKNPLLKYYAQKTLFLEKEEMIRTLLMDMDREIKRIILIIKMFQENDEEIDELSEEVDELYADIADRFEYAFNLFQELEVFLMKSFTSKQRTNIRASLNSNELTKSLDDIYGILRNDIVEGDAVIMDELKREFLFELLNLKRLLSSAIIKTGSLDEIIEKPNVKSEEKTTPKKKQSLKKKSV
jgi:hypothetical protein